MTQRSPTDLKADPAPVESGPAFLDALRATVGPRHFLTRPQDTERFRMGYRSGGGEAEAEPGAEAGRRGGPIAPARRREPRAPAAWLRFRLAAKPPITLATKGMRRRCSG